MKKITLLAAVSYGLLRCAPGYSAPQAHLSPALAAPVEAAHEHEHEHEHQHEEHEHHHHDDAAPEAAAPASLRERTVASLRDGFKKYEAQHQRKKRILFLPPVIHGEAQALYDRLLAQTRYLFSHEFADSQEVDPVEVAKFADSAATKYGYESEYSDEDLAKLAEHFNANTVVAVRGINLRQFRDPEMTSDQSQRFMLECCVYKADKNRKVFRNAIMTRFHPREVDALDRDFNRATVAVVSRLFVPYLERYEDFGATDRAEAP